MSNTNPLAAARSRVGMFLSNYREALWVSATLLTIQVTYLWFITAGTYDRWPVYGIAYDWLADAFRAGQLHVLRLPNPELLTKENPYDKIHARLWIGDLSLWNGKYYLYWGPVPAAIQAVGKSWLGINETIGDQYLNFLFVSIAGLSAAFLVFRLATQLFSGIPLPVISLAMLTVAFANPILHSLCNGNHYLVAIMGAGGFIVLGVLLAFEALLSTSRKKDWLFFLASLSWGLAMGCRASVAPAVIIVALAVALMARPIWTTPWKQMARSHAAILAPTGIAGVLLLYYNWLRFDDIFEFGTNIQTGPFPFSFEARQIPANLYAYLLRPPAISCHFPYVFQEWFPAADSFPSFLERPDNYLLNEPVVGLLLVTPLLFFAPFAFMGFNRNHDPHKRSAYLFCVVAFGACGTVSGITPLGLYMATMRYQGDIIWGACLLSLVGFLCVWSKRGAWPYRILSWVSVPVALSTILLGMALGYQSYNGHVHHQNPTLDKSLRKALSVCPKDAPKFPRFAPNGNTNED